MMMMMTTMTEEPSGRRRPHKESEIHKEATFSSTTPRGRKEKVEQVIKEGEMKSRGVGDEANRVSSEWTKRHHSLTAATPGIQTSMGHLLMLFTCLLFLRFSK